MLLLARQKSTPPQLFLQDRARWSSIRKKENHHTYKIYSEIQALCQESRHWRRETNKWWTHTATFETSADVCESWHPEIMWTSALMAFLACSNASLMIVNWDYVNVVSKTMSEKISQPRSENSLKVLEDIWPDDGVRWEMRKKKASELWNASLLVGLAWHFTIMSMYTFIPGSWRHSFSIPVRLHSNTYLRWYE